MNQFIARFGWGPKQSFVVWTLLFWYQVAAANPPTNSVIEKSNPGVRLESPGVDPDRRQQNPSAPKPDAARLAANKTERFAKTKALVQLVQIRDNLANARGDTSQLDLKIASERLHLAQLSYQIAADGNVLIPGSTSNQVLEGLKRATLIRWGKAVNGVQIGLERTSLPDDYAPGTVVEFQRRVRNTTSASLQLTLRFCPGEKAEQVVYDDGRIAVNSFGAPSASQVVALSAGEDRPIIGSILRIDTKGMWPGHYRVESYDRFVLNEAESISKQLVASSPTRTQNDLPLTFEVRSETDITSSDVHQPFPLQGGPEIAWGAPNLGLQAGLRYARGLLKPAAFNDVANWEWTVGDTVNTEVIIRNVSRAPRPVTYPVLDGGQLVPLTLRVTTLMAYEENGPILPAASRPRKRGGPEPRVHQRTQVLPPGEMIVIAASSFKLMEKALNDQNDPRIEPHDALIVEPAKRYIVRTRIEVRGAISPALNLRTGRLRLWLRDPNSKLSETIAAEPQGKGTLTVHYDLPGTEPVATIVIRSLDARSESLTMRVPNGTMPVTSTTVPEGRYEVFRQVTLDVGSWRKSVACNRQIVTVVAGTDVDVKITRPLEHLVTPVGVWESLGSLNVAGAFLTIHPLAETSLTAGNVADAFDFDNDRETLAATACGPDGKFRFEPLPRGRYVIVLRAFDERRSPVEQTIVMPYRAGARALQLVSHLPANEIAKQYVPIRDGMIQNWNAPQWIPEHVPGQSGSRVLQQRPVSSGNSSGADRTTAVPVPVAVNGIDRQSARPAVIPDARATGVKDVDQGREISSPPATQFGSLKGRFVFDGDLPGRKDPYAEYSQIDLSQPLPLDRDGRFSGVEMTYRTFLQQGIVPDTKDQSLIIGPDRGIANVVVWVTSKDVPWKAPEDLDLQPVRIRFYDGNYSPRFVMLTPGQPLLVENHDPLAVNFHAMPVRNSERNVALRPRSFGDPIQLQFSAPESLPVAFRSDAAAWAKGWFCIQRHPFAAVSRADGTFEIPNLPLGTWEFRAWHERCGYLTHWPRGLFKKLIQPDDNELGTVTLTAENFGEKPAAVNAVKAPEQVVPPPQANAPCEASSCREGSGLEKAEAAIPTGTLRGRFISDREPTPSKNLAPELSNIDLAQPQRPRPDGLYSRIEGMYREFQSHRIRPRTEDTSLLVGRDRGIANVLVWVANHDVPWSPPREEEQFPVMIRLKDGNFTPRITVVTTNQQFAVRNLDPVINQFHLELPNNFGLNIGLPKLSRESPGHWSFPNSEPLPTRFKSDLWPWADGWLFVRPNPYVAISQEDGSFTLPDLPVGKWDFRVWHERQGFVKHWPKGRFQFTIERGENTLGTIALKPEMLTLPVTAPAHATSIVSPAVSDKNSRETITKPVPEETDSDFNPNELPAIRNCSVILVDGITDKPVPNITFSANSVKSGFTRPQKLTFTSDAHGCAEISLFEGSSTSIYVTSIGWWSGNSHVIGSHPKLSRSETPVAKSDEPSAAFDPAKPQPIKIWKGTVLTGKLVTNAGQTVPGVGLTVSLNIADGKWQDRLELVRPDSSVFATYRSNWPNWFDHLVTDSEGAFMTTIPPPEARGVMTIRTKDIRVQSAQNAGDLAKGPAKAAFEFAPFEMKIDDARQSEPSEINGRWDLGFLKLDSGTILRGRVISDDDQPLAGVQLEISSDRSVQRRFTISGEGGHFEFLPLSAGAYKLTADARLRYDNGEILSRDPQAVFTPLEVTLPASPSPHAVTLRSIPQVTLEFEWIDRRAKKGPVSRYGAMRVTGLIPRAGAMAAPWSGETERTRRGEAAILYLKVPASLTEAVLHLPVDDVVTASYEDDQTKSGPGEVVLGDVTIKRRRVIYGDEPRPQK